MYVYIYICVCVCMYICLCVYDSENGINMHVHVGYIVYLQVCKLGLKFKKWKGGLGGGLMRGSSIQGSAKPSSQAEALVSHCRPIASQRST